MYKTIVTTAINSFKLFCMTELETINKEKQYYSCQVLLQLLIAEIFYSTFS